MLSNIFEHVCVINLSYRKERLDAFFERLPNDWPFLIPQKFNALDGGLISPPDWWNGGGGAWGCYKGHLRILEDCLNNEINSVLILEDDAVCVDQFAQKVSIFWNHLPSDWEMLYLGGQHIQENLRLPRKVNEWVYKPFNVNRCHCYGFRGRRIIERAYKHLNNFFDWKVDHHVDHYLGELHKKMDTGLYVPKEWLVAQSEGKSDICGDELGLRLFPSSEETVYPTITKNGIAVLGDYFGGTNTVAGLLWHLGISLGTDVPIATSSDAPLFFEDRYLSEICRNSFEEPWLTDILSSEDRTNHLRRWAGWQCKLKPEGRFFCGKHPILSLMGPEILDTWRDPSFIIVDRPMEDTIRTMSRVSWAWHPSVVKHTMMKLKQARNDFINSRSPKCLCISFNDMVEKPQETIQSICDFLPYMPSTEQYNNAKIFLESSKDDYCVGEKNGH